MNRNILIISTEYPPGPGGIGQHAYSLSKALHNLGYTIKVLTPADYATPNEVSKFDYSQPFKVNRYTRLNGLFTYTERLKQTLSSIRETQFSTVILTGKFSLWQGLIIKILFPKINTIAILHGSEVQLDNPIYRWLTYYSIYKANVIVPVTEFTKNLLPEWIRLNHSNIQIIKNGINFIPNTLNFNKCNHLQGTPRLLTVGHLSLRKGQHRVIKALPSLIKLWPTIHYHIVGLPNNQTYLEELADQLKVKQHITFHGRVAEHRDLSTYYQQADIFMLLSENQPDGDVEGFGIVALEANAYGVPVVGAKYCGVEEAVEHLKSGYLVDGNDSDEITEGVKFCLANKETLKIGAKAWAIANQWSSIVQQYKTLLG